MKLNKYLYILFGLLFLGNLTIAQNTIQITGTVLDAANQQALEFATVMIGDQTTKEVITGTTTGPDGSFQATVKAEKIYLEISFIGFDAKTIDEVPIVNGKAELGEIFLGENSQMLEEAVVRAEKSSTEFKLDKRVFNVGQDLSSTGASALELLNNVPSVTVNIEGEVALRGSTGVQILIDGKPSVMTSDNGNALGTITADMIEKIEVITNPSAKYDAEGTTGIINIVLRKEEKEGLNGSISVNTGIPHNHSIGLSLNRRTQRFNLFSQLGAGYRELPRVGRNVNTDLINNTSINSEGTAYRNEAFYNAILGADYHINKYNVLTLSGYFAYEVEDQPSQYDFTQTDADGNVLTAWERSEVTEATNPKFQYELNYKKDFKDNKEHTFIFSALGKFFGKDQASTFTNITSEGVLSFGDQDTRTNFQEGGYTFKADYNKPFNEKWSMEVGAQYDIQDVSNDFAVINYVNGEPVQDEGLTNIFEYNQKVLGAYVTGAYEGEKWGLKVGMRVEDTDLKTFLVNTEEDGSQDYTNLFPSAHTSYKFSERLSVQAGYSRRVRRPRLWDLNPFFNIRNNFNIRMGNPELLPEFTDSYEVTGIYILEKISLNLGVYHLYTTDVVERVSFFENGVTTTKPVNIGTNRATGIEFNAKYSASKWLVFNGDFNYNYFNRVGTLENVSFDFNAGRWTSRLTAKLKLPAKIDFEINGNYESGFLTVQGQRSPFLFADLGLRKKMMKGKAVISASVRDVFASRIFESEAIQPNFSTYSYSFRGRFFTLGFSYGFGKGEAMEFSGSRRRH